MIKKILRSLGFYKKTLRQDKPVGEVTHYYSGLGVAIVKFDRDLPVGKNLTFLGGTTDFSQDVDSMQMDRQPISIAPKGKEIGIKVKAKTREGDKVYLN